MTIQTYFANRLKQACSRTRSLIIYGVVMVGLVDQTQLLVAQVVTIEVEHGVTLDTDDNRIYVANGDEVYMTQDGTILFQGSPVNGSDDIQIYSSKADAGPGAFHASSLPFGFQQTIYDGNQTLAYIDSDDGVWVLNLETGEAVQQGVQAHELINLTDDGRALYIAYNLEDNFDRVWLGNELRYIEDTPVGEYIIDDLRRENVIVTGNGDLYIAPEEATGSVDLLLKNNVLIQTFESNVFDALRPTTGDGYILFLQRPYRAVLNGSQMVVTPDLDIANLQIDFTLITDNGDIYFSGIRKIWHFDASQEIGEEGAIVTLALDVQEHGLTSFAPVGETSRGDLVFGARDPQLEFAIYLFEAESGEVRPLLKPGDIVGDREVRKVDWGYDRFTLEGVGFANDQVVVAGQLTDTLGEVFGKTIFRIDVYGTAGPVYTVSENCPEVPAGFVENQSFEESVTNYPDPFTSSDQIDIREGPCGGNWHTRIWKDTDTGEDLDDFIPGTLGNEDVIVDIPEVNLILQDGDISVKSVLLGGNFTVFANLTLEDNSTIENLTLVADLEANGILSLKGETLWEDGTIYGTGPVVLSFNDSMIIDNMFDPLKFGTDLQLHGKVSHDIGTLELSTATASITIQDNGTYTAKSGGVLGITGSANFINYGDLIKKEETEFIVDTIFENRPDAEVDVQGGSLIFNDNANLSGELEIANASEIRMRNADFALSFEDDLRVNGDGELKLENAEIVLLDNGLATFDLAGRSDRPDDLEEFFDVNGGVSVQENATISGEGIYFNQGFTFVEGGAVESHIHNYTGTGTPEDLDYKFAGLSQSSGSVTGGIENWGVVHLTGGNLTGEIENHTDFYLQGGIVESEFNNHGKLYLEVKNQEIPLDVSRLSLENDGMLIKNGDETLLLKSITNSGKIEIQSGKLHVSDALSLTDTNLAVGFDEEFKSGGEISIAGENQFTGEGNVLFPAATINVADDAKLWNKTSIQGDGMTFANNTILLGTGVSGNVSNVGHFSNAGKVYFQSGIMEDLIVRNLEGPGTVTFYFEDAAGEADELRVINGHFLNFQLVEQRAPVEVGSKAIIQNTGIWNLWPGGDFLIYDINDTQKFDNKPEGLILKEGNGETIFDVFLSNDGNISVNEGTLRLTRGATFNSDFDKALITLRNGANFHLESIADVFHYEFNGHTDIQGEDGGGTFIIDAPIKVSGSEFFIQTNAEWRSGDIFLDSEDITFWAEDSNQTLKILGEELTISNNGHIEILGGTTVDQTSEIKVENSGINISVEGDWYLGADIKRKEESGFGGLFAVIKGGRLIIKEDLNTQIFTPLLVTTAGTVKTEKGATFRSETIKDDFGKPMISDDGSLQSSSWLLSPQSRIEIMDDRSIYELEGTSFVNLAENSSLNNLPTINGNFKISYPAGLFLDGSTFTLSGDLHVQGLLSGENGIINLQDGKTLFVESITAARSLFGGTLSGNLHVVGGVISTARTIPGLSAGEISIDGDFTQTETGTLEIEIFGTEAGSEYDQLNVNGTATLGGTLHIFPQTEILDGSFFEPLLATNIEGNFDRIIVENESARETYDVSTIETGIQISPTTLSVTTFSEYQDALFSEMDAADETIGLTTSDPDNDQFSNLLEYAMDLNPWVTNDNPMEAEFESNESGEFNRVTVTFPWAKDMTDVDYVIQVSSDISDWTDIASMIEGTIDQGTHDLLTVGAAIDPPVTEKLFIRILVTQSEL